MAKEISTLTKELTRQRLIVKGVVQGVGFRPFVYGLAQRLGVSGFVGNDSGGVFIEIEAEPQVLTAFRHELVTNPPPLAFIESVTVEILPACHANDFVIVASAVQNGVNTLISPDLSICDDCLRELFDPQDRRYRYPFINCTNCGPRFTIIKDTPYDRLLTTMAEFKMCPACQAEYDNPLNRRFHAQPNACPECGPQIAFQTVAAPQQILSEDSAILAAQKALNSGQIVAVKGIGGFHLAANACDDQALLLLRQRKGRQDKPFAIMARDVAAVRQFAYVNEQEEILLTSRARPIVLLRKKSNGNLSEHVAPGNAYIGVMLPYSPLHYLLVGDTPLVMTSGNFSSEPIVTDNAAGLEKLAPLADAFLLHNRAIYVPCDDSVIRVSAGQELPIRRSRGYAPFPVKLPFSVPATLAVGGELKSTFCLTKGDYAFMSQHIGDMENLETLEAFTHAYNHFQALFRVAPQLVVADRHLRYLSASWAQNFADKHKLPLVQVQHHHAHIAAVMAEHGLDGTSPVIGFSFDGTGYGTDGAIWGGEVLLADYAGFRRFAHLKYIPLPGGDAAVKRPYRVALAHLWAAGVAWDEALPPVGAASPTEKRILTSQLAKGINIIPTSSMGRLFDAVAALVGVRQTVTYEAQAAIEFEALATDEIADAYEFDLDEGGETLIFAPDNLLKAIVADITAGVPLALISTKFHRAVANLILELSLRMRTVQGLNTVALSGGVFQNVLLLKITTELLKANNFAVLTHRRVPPNDGGLALGQAVIAAHLYKEEEK